jgi:predicted transcriptional regulator
MKTMNVAKSEVQHLLNNMPDECDIEDLHYRLYVLEKIKRGQEAVKNGETLTQDEVRDRISKKWQK